jgi:hypothetical protein
MLDRRCRRTRIRPSTLSQASISKKRANKRRAAPLTSAWRYRVRPAALRWRACSGDSWCCLTGCTASDSNFSQGRGLARHFGPGPRMLCSSGRADWSGNRRTIMVKSYKLRGATKSVLYLRAPRGSRRAVLGASSRALTADVLRSS